MNYHLDPIEQAVLELRYDERGRVLHSYAEIAEKLNIKSRYLSQLPLSVAYMTRCAGMGKLIKAQRRAGDGHVAGVSLDLLRRFAPTIAEFSRYEEAPPKKNPKVVKDAEAVVKAKLTKEKSDGKLAGNDKVHGRVVGVPERGSVHVLGDSVVDDIRLDGKINDEVAKKKESIIGASTTTPITTLRAVGLTKYSLGLLRKYRYYTVGDIEHVTDAELLGRVRGLGESALGRVRELVPYKGKKK